MSEITLEAKNGDILVIEFPDGPCNITAPKENKYPIDISQFLKVKKLDINIS